MKNQLSIPPRYPIIGEPWHREDGVTFTWQGNRQGWLRCES